MADRRDLAMFATMIGIAGGSAALGVIMIAGGAICLLHSHSMGVCCYGAARNRIDQWRKPCAD